MRLCRLLASLVSTLCFALLNAQAANAQKYTVIDLGTLPGGSASYGYGINESGQVTGYSSISATCPVCGPFHAFLYSDGKMQDLGTLPDGTQSYGYGVNQSGQVTGFSTIGSNEVHAFLYSDAKMQNLGTLPGGNFSRGLGINRSGQVTGDSSIGVGLNFVRAFRYSDGKMQDLGTGPGGYSSNGFAINQSGQVTGTLNPNAGTTHAFLYSHGRMQDLGTLPGGGHSEGNAINRAGQVTGFSDTPACSSCGPFSNPKHAFLYSHGKMQDLGTLPGGINSIGSGINGEDRRGREWNEGAVGVQVVGSSDFTGSLSSHAFLYSDGIMKDLNSLIPENSGWVLEVAKAINDRGQITGYGTINEAIHAFLLTPVCSDDGEHAWNAKEHDRDNNGCGEERSSGREQPQTRHR